MIAQGVERPYPRALGGPPNPPIWSCSRWGLPCVHHHWRTGELLPRLFNLTGSQGTGGMFSVVLSPDHSGPPLTATLSCGVRTFLPRACARGAIAQSTLARVNFWPRCRSLIGQPIRQFIHFATHMNNTIDFELTQQSQRASKQQFEFLSLTRYSPFNCFTKSWESLCTRILFLSYLPASRGLPCNAPSTTTSHSFCDPTLTRAKR